MDCGDNSCFFAEKPLTGMRTNGGCRCLSDLPRESQREVKALIFRLRSESQHRAEENQRLRNDLADALDLKAGHGPTALSMLAARVAELGGLLRSHRSALICDNLHHSSRQYHLASQECPVEAEIDRILAGKGAGNA